VGVDVGGGVPAGVLVGVLVGVFEGVLVGVDVGVGVGVRVGQGPRFIIGAGSVPYGDVCHPLRGTRVLSFVIL
jgi:hypothetical protein